MNNTNNGIFSLIPKNGKQVFLNGPVGKLDCLELIPSNKKIDGIAIICHPDPKGGGNYTNKIVQTLSKVINQQNFLCYCPNLRGVGMSDGVHDYGVGEVDDVEAIYTHLRSQFPDIPLILAGFSFGTAVVSNFAKRLNGAYFRLILVGPAVTRYTIETSDVAKTVVIQGEEDEVISTTSVLEWAKAKNQPIIWVPDCGHFFHGKLITLQNILMQLNYK